MIRLNLVAQTIFCVALCLPRLVAADQTDQRLDELFLTLQNSNDAVVLLEVEASIWEIWFESGSAEVNTLMAQANAAAKSGQLSAAETLYDQVIEQLPGFSEGWNRRATVRYYRSNFDGSLEDIEHTLRLEPRHFGAIWGLGMILGSKLEYERAILAFERLLEIKPNSADARPRIELLRQELAKQAV